MDEVVIYDAVNRLRARIDQQARELEDVRADLYQCKKEREILMHELTAFTGNA